MEHVPTLQCIVEVVNRSSSVSLDSSSSLYPLRLDELRSVTLDPTLPVSLSGSHTISFLF